MRAWKISQFPRSVGVNDSMLSTFSIVAHDWSSYPSKWSQIERFLHYFFKKIQGVGHWNTDPFADKWFCFRSKCRAQGSPWNLMRLIAAAVGARSTSEVQQLDIHSVWMCNGWSDSWEKRTTMNRHRFLSRRLMMRGRWLSTETFFSRFFFNFYNSSGFMVFFSSNCCIFMIRKTVKPTPFSLTYYLICDINSVRESFLTVAWWWITV